MTGALTTKSFLLFSCGRGLLCDDRLRGLRFLIVLAKSSFFSLFSLSEAFSLPEVSKWKLLFLLEMTKLVLSETLLETDSFL